ncbi:TRAPP II complex [Cokeromyces recurvatus]|uniref:TRAPP II complex n=1 Tax=Cokeromyces recurvatus TaxID=90255 RepID=UPI002220D960|nr:TRAPP II complex [Cokeromyces recurvatus]KAI7900256.1 TRAPP II complex [Cokeromyces recurvatus]
MDLVLDITSACRVRILLIPVSPIKKSTFWKHVELVKKFSLVRLGDVTPDLHKGANAKFSSQVFQEGQMHFEFITNYNRDHCHLEDFQPHRRIFGVIGIMDCQEWRNKDLSEGYKRFVDMLSQYPTAIATRCFAFDPTENQPDDTKGLIMIPNVGNMSFYMSTMICDFASEILDQFAAIAERIENLKVLESPLPVGYTPKSFEQSNGNQMIQPQPSTSSPYHQNNKNSQSGPTPVSSISSSFLKRASSTINNNRKGLNANNPPPTPKPSLTRSSTFTGTSLSAASDTSRTIQRTPGRIKKLLADFYLLAGRLPDAIKHYNEAIEVTQSSNDYLWLASAKEGLACTLLLMAYLHTDVGHIVSRQAIVNEENSTMDSKPASVAENEDKNSKTIVTEITEMYEELIQIYEKVNTTTNIPLPKLVYAEASLKIARFLTAIFLNGGWNDTILTNIIQHPTLDVFKNSTKKRENRFMTAEDLVKYKGSEIPRFSIAKWVTRVWSMSLDNMIIMDQINIMTQMSSILSNIGYHRKSAWIMYETLNRMVPLLIQGRAAMASINANKKNSAKADDGILEVLKRICEVYGIGESNVQDGGTLQIMQNICDSQQEKVKVNPSSEATNIGFGWAVLQIDVLRECIVVSEAIQDHASMLYYTTVLLKNLYQHISKDEQIRLASSIQRIVNISKRTGKVDKCINYWGFNIVKSIEPIPPIPRKAIYQHPLLIAKALAASKEGKTSSGDPFIYNPFTKKNNDKPQINLIKDETCEFNVALFNPFGFDLELSNIILSTSGVKFSPIPTAATIPANDTLILRLMGTPLEIGTLVIRGCIIKITGFAEQEFLNEKPKIQSVDQSKKKEAAQQTNNSQRFKFSGLQALYRSSSELDKLTADTESTDTIEHEILNVIEDQPLLKIKSTSLLHGAVMLFEGEMTHIRIDVENIGNIPVDFITLSFTDSITNYPKPINPELPAEEQYEIELYTKGTPVFSWEGSKNNGSQIGKRINLPPGQHTEVFVNIYGKQGCTGGAIYIDYGYLDRAIQGQTKKIIYNDEGLPTTLYTRQLYLPIMITVYQNLEPLNWDVLYLRDNMSVTKSYIDEAINTINKLDIQNIKTTEQPVEELLMLTQQSNDNNDKNPYCLLTLDVRNTWTTPFDIEFVIDNRNNDNENVDSNILKSVLTIQPALTKRIVFPLKKLFLTSEERLQPIPSFEPNKQFVVSQAPKMTPEQEYAHLQMFWYKEKLLSRIKATWQCRASRRRGIINLRPSLRLTGQQLNILKMQDIEFIINMREEEGVKTVGHRQFECKVNSFVHMNVTIVNRQGKDKMIYICIYMYIMNI